MFKMYEGKSENAVGVGKWVKESMRRVAGYLVHETTCILGIGSEEGYTLGSNMKWGDSAKKIARFSGNIIHISHTVSYIIR